MSDIIDIANEHAERHREDALRNFDARRAQRDGGGPRRGDNRCELCGDEIPAARLAVLPHASMCVDCQGFSEQKQQGQRR